MKQKTSFYFKLFIICTLSVLLMGFSGYFYLLHSIKSTENETKSIPYTSPIPENKGILLDASGDITFFYLDFENQKLNVILLENKPQEKSVFGYDIDFTVKSDDEMIEKFIDSIDGIDVTINGENLRATGVQVLDMLNNSEDRLTVKREIINKIMLKISKYGLEKLAFKEIIEYSNTDMTIPDCYYFADYIKTLCKNGEIIN